MRMTMAAVLGATLISAATIRLKPDTTYPRVRGVRLQADREEARGVRLQADREEVRGVRLQPDRDPIERGTLRLHYVQKPIGYERYEITRDGDALKLSSDVDFTDRGGRVQLAATLRTKADFTPLAFKATGKSYRFV